MAIPNESDKRVLTPEGYAVPDGEGWKRYVYVRDVQGNIRAVVGENNAVAEQTDYYPYGMPMADVNSASAQPFKFGGKELEREGGMDFYDFEARRLDFALGRFTSPDPLCEQTPEVSPYAYCAADPVNYTDPTGKYVIAHTAEEKRMILNTIPAELRAEIKFENGLLLPESIQSIDSDDQNFNDLKAMAINDQYTFEARLDTEYIYKDKNGEIHTCDMNYTGVDEYFKRDENDLSTGPSTGETGLLGKTLFPDLNGAENSTTDHIIIVVNSQLSEKGRAEIFAHEGYGHGYIYMISNRDRKRASHDPPKIGFKDLNRELFNRISRAISNTIINMK